jgi:hypothetical protein
MKPFITSQCADIVQRTIGGTCALDSKRWKNGKIESEVVVIVAWKMAMKFVRANQIKSVCTVINSTEIIEVCVLRNINKLHKKSQMSATVQINNTSPMEQNEENAMLSHEESVFLQTALTDIQSPTSNQNVKARILLDCGSQRTYITQSLADKLRLKQQYVEEFHVFTFGGKDARVIKTEAMS